jgi:hypothetical protein
MAATLDARYGARQIFTVFYPREKAAKLGGTG